MLLKTNKILLTAIKSTCFIFYSSTFFCFSTAQTNQKNNVKLECFVDNVFDMQEQQLRMILHKPLPLDQVHQKAGIRLEDRDGITFLHTKKGTYQCGFFKQISLGSLIDQCADKQMPGKGSLTVYIGHKTNTESSFINQVNIGAQEADAINNGATFLVASNFNGLETTNKNQDLCEQTLTSYIWDQTQGPYAVIPTAGLYQRALFPFWQSKPYNPQIGWYASWAQATDGENRVNFLESLSGKIAVTPAGYIDLAQSHLSMPTRDDYRNITVGYQGETEVIYGPIHKGKMPFIAGSRQIINQIFAAAINWADNLNYAFLQQQEAIAWGKALINASIEGALRLTFLNKKASKKVFLTFIGCGVFGNKLEWVVDAIESMHSFIAESGLTVFLTWYRFPENDFDAITQKHRLNGIVKTIGNGGSMIDYN